LKITQHKMDASSEVCSSVSNTTTQTTTTQLNAGSNNNSSSNSNNNSSNNNNNNTIQDPQLPKVSAFFSSSSNYQSRVQQLISFSFTSSFHLIFITCILSISKFCNAAAVNAAQVTAAAPSPSLIISNLSGSALLEKIRMTTLGPQLDKLKSFTPAAANSISSGSSSSNSKSLNLNFLNVSGRINTYLDICK